MLIYKALFVVLLIALFVLLGRCVNRTAANARGAILGTACTGFLLLVVLCVMKFVLPSHPIPLWLHVTHDASWTLVVLLFIARKYHFKKRAYPSTHRMLRLANVFLLLLVATTGTWALYRM
jgi:hypothetical protein